MEDEAKGRVVQDKEAVRWFGVLAEAQTADSGTLKVALDRDPERAPN